MASSDETVVLSVGPFESNCYFLIRDPACIVIDPGDEAPRILRELDRRSLRLDAVLLTHGHIDHISGLSGLLARYPAPTYLHPADTGWAFEGKNHLPPWYNEPSKEKPSDMRDPRTPHPLTVGPWSFHLFETPGHTPGSVCYHLPEPGILFSGDTLFRGSIGRTDLPGGNPAKLAASLRLLAQLPADTRVYPGHGDETRLEHERRTNPWLS